MYQLQCMYVCMYVHVLCCMYVILIIKLIMIRAHVFVDVVQFVWTINLYMCVYTHIIHVHVCMYICMYACGYVRTYYIYLCKACDIHIIVIHAWFIGQFYYNTENIFPQY